MRLYSIFSVSVLIAFASVGFGQDGNYEASIHYNTYDAGGLSRGGGIGEAFSQTSGIPPQNSSTA